MKLIVIVLICFCPIKNVFSNDKQHFIETFLSAFENNEIESMVRLFHYQLGQKEADRVKDTVFVRKYIQQLVKSLPITNRNGKLFHTKQEIKELGEYPLIILKVHTGDKKYVNSKQGKLVTLIKEFNITKERTDYFYFDLLDNNGRWEILVFGYLQKSSLIRLKPVAKLYSMAMMKELLKAAGLSYVWEKEMKFLERNNHGDREIIKKNQRTPGTNGLGGY